MAHLSDRSQAHLAYTIPKVDVLVSSTFRSGHGAPLNANWNATNAQVLPFLGRRCRAVPRW